MLVSLWQMMISILVLVVCSLGNSKLHKLTGLPLRPLHLPDDGERLIQDPPPPLFDWVDGVVHGQDRMNGMIAEAGAIQRDDGCSSGQTKQLSDIQDAPTTPRDGPTIASRNTPEKEDGHQNGEACRNIGAMSDVPLIPLSDLDAIVEADRKGPEADPNICEDFSKPIPVCAPDQPTDGANVATQLQRCRPYIPFLGCAPNLLWCCMLIWPNPEVVFQTPNDMDPFFQYGGGNCVKASKGIFP